MEETMSAKWKFGLTTLALLASTAIAFGQESTTPSLQAPRDPLAVIRSLLADPDFKASVVPAENAWNFNEPESVPGFGPIEAKDDQRVPMPQTAQR
jgi:hypothetical protein